MDHSHSMMNKPKQLFYNSRLQKVVDENTVISQIFSVAGLSIVNTVAANETVKIPMHAAINSLSNTPKVVIQHLSSEPPAWGALNLSVNLLNLAFRSFPLSSSRLPSQRATY